MRKMGPLWRIALLLGLTGDLGTQYILDSADRVRTVKEEDDAIIGAHLSMSHSIMTMGLDEVWDERPLFGGNEVAKILPRLPRGPMYRVVMQKQIEFMLKNPGATKEEGEAFLREEFSGHC
ncbi:unnamed protein product [Choristocarpus tenellus]